MSLINDALKRASQTKPTLPSAAQDETPLRPVEYHRPSALRFILPPALLLLLALAGWFFVKSWQAGRTASFGADQIAAREPDEPDTNADHKPVLVKDLVTLKNSHPVVAADPDKVDPTPSAPVTVEKTSPAVATTTTVSPSNVQAVAVAPAKPTFPSLRLQGVFYRSRNPSVIINSKTVSIGQKVANAKVLAITRDSVTLEWNGETRVLTLD